MSVSGSGGSQHPFDYDADLSNSTNSSEAASNTLEPFQGTIGERLTQKSVSPRAQTLKAASGRTPRRGARTPPGGASPEATLRLPSGAEKSIGQNIATTVTQESVSDVFPKAMAQPSYGTFDSTTKATPETAAEKLQKIEESYKKLREKSWEKRNATTPAKIGPSFHEASAEIEATRHLSEVKQIKEAEIARVRDKWWFKAGDWIRSIGLLINTNVNTCDKLIRGLGVFREQRNLNQGKAPIPINEFVSTRVLHNIDVKKQEAGRQFDEEKIRAALHSKMIGVPLKGIEETHFLCLQERYETTKFTLAFVKGKPTVPEGDPSEKSTEVAREQFFRLNCSVEFRESTKRYMLTAECNGISFEQEWDQDHVENSNFYLEQLVGRYTVLAKDRINENIFGSGEVLSAGNHGITVERDFQNPMCLSVSCPSAYPVPFSKLPIELEYTQEGFKCFCTIADKRIELPEMKFPVDWDFWRFALQERLKPYLLLKESVFDNLSKVTLPKGCSVELDLERPYGLFIILPPTKLGISGAYDDKTAEIRFNSASDGSGKIEWPILRKNGEAEGLKEWLQPIIDRLEVRKFHKQLLVNGPLPVVDRQTNILTAALTAQGFELLVYEKRAGIQPQVIGRHQVKVALVNDVWECHVDGLKEPIKLQLNAKPEECLIDIVSAINLQAEEIQASEKRKWEALQPIHTGFREIKNFTVVGQGVLWKYITSDAEVNRAIVLPGQSQGLVQLTESGLRITQITVPRLKSDAKRETVTYDVKIVKDVSDPSCFNCSCEVGGRIIELDDIHPDTVRDWWPKALRTIKASEG